MHRKGCEDTILDDYYYYCYYAHRIHHIMCTAIKLSLLLLLFIVVRFALGRNAWRDERKHQEFLLLVILASKLISRRESRSFSHRTPPLSLSPHSFLLFLLSTSLCVRACVCASKQAVDNECTHKSFVVLC